MKALEGSEFLKDIQNNIRRHEEHSGFDLTITGVNLSHSKARLYDGYMLTYGELYVKHTHRE